MKEDCLEQERMTAILGCMGDGVISTDTEGVIDYMNSAAEKLTGWNLNEAKGLNLEHVFRIINYDTGESLKSPVFKALESGTIVGLKKQNALIQRNGAKIFVSASCSSVRHTDGNISGAVIVFRDITRINQAEKALRDSEEKFRNVFNKATDAIFLQELLEEEGKVSRIIEANDVACERLGYTRNELIGMSPIQINSPKCREIVLSTRIRLNTEPHIMLESIQIAKDGREIPVELNLHRFELQGKQMLVSVARDITERKKAENLIKESQTKYQLLFYNMSHAFAYFKVVPDENSEPGSLEFIQVNSAFEKMFDLKSEAIIGRNFKEFFSYSSQYFMDIIRQNYRQNRKLDNIRIDEFYAENLTRWFTISAYVPESGYFATIISDITERKIAEKRIEESRIKHQALLMNMHNCFGYFKLVLDEDNNPVDFIYIEINDAFEQMMRIKREDIIGKNFLEVFPGHKELFSAFSKGFEKVALNGESMKLDDFYTANIHRWFSIYAYSTHKGYFAVIITDITEQKSAAETMKKAKEAAEAASRTKSEFLANMSHEIRTPLNGMLGMIDLTLLSDLSFEQKDNLATAKTCANSLLKIINDILDFSKMEAGKLVIESISYDIKELISDTVKAHSPRAAAKGIELSYTLSSTIPQYIIGDPNRMQQILNNLLSNAIKFTENGNVTISVRKIISDDDEAELVFAVADTGIGIAPGEMDMLFKSFSQVDSSFTRQFGGTGLGLVISRQLAEMMGGRMWVESEKGKGSTFCFTITCKSGTREAAKIKEPVRIFKASHLLHVLLVEDDNINQKVIIRMLKENGYSVECACNGIEAVEMYEQGKYDVILMDIQMPEMDGIEAAKRVRQKETGIYTPIIALTAYALQGDKERFLSMGMDEYISKPIQMDELFYKLDRVSALRQKAAYNTTGVGESSRIQSNELRKTTLKEEQLPALGQMSDCIGELAAAMEDSNLPLIESIAHKIKSLANSIEADELKSAAFKIELAARRGNIMDAIESSTQIKHEFKTFKKSIS